MGARRASDITKVFGLVLKTARKNKKISQERLAELSGCTTVSISNIENGVHGPNVELVIKIELALGLHPGALSAKTGELLLHTLAKKPGALTAKTHHLLKEFEQTRAARSKPN